MNLDPGATVLRNAMEELKPGLEQFNKKLLMEAWHVKVMPPNHETVTKSLVNVSMQ